MVSTEGRRHGCSWTTPSEFPFVRYVHFNFYCYFPNAGITGMASTPSHLCPLYSTLIFRECLFHLALSSQTQPRGVPYSSPRKTLWDRGLSGLSLALTGYGRKDSKVSLWLQGRTILPLLNPQQTSPARSLVDLLGRHRSGEVGITVTLEIRTAWLSHMFCQNSLPSPPSA